MAAGERWVAAATAEVGIGKLLAIQERRLASIQEAGWVVQSRRPSRRKRVVLPVWSEASL
jgi:hypothetical protein